MKYETRKVEQRIVFMPDDELKEVLWGRLRWMKKVGLVSKSPISCYSTKNGLKKLLSRHAGDRMFITIDFIYAFHQITRDMIAEVVPVIKDTRFDVCFAKLQDRAVVPIGFPTSNCLFELFVSRKIDKPLMDWQTKHRGTITRFTDNVVATWRKNTDEAFRDLKACFSGLNVRFTPQRPRRCSQPIRFCGIIIPQRGKPHLSNSRKEKILQTMNERSLNAQEGVEAFLRQWR